MSSFSFSRLFPSWFSPPSAPSVDNVMDEHTPSLSRTKRPKQTKTKTARTKRQEVSSSFDDVTMKDAAPNLILSVDNVEVEDAVNPTIQDIERWDATKLAKWIQQVLDPPLNPRNEKIMEAEINGRVFLRNAGNRDFFRRDAGLSLGASDDLADLAKNMTSPAIQGKLLSFIPYSKH